MDKLSLMGVDAVIIGTVVERNENTKGFGFIRAGLGALRVGHDASCPLHNPQKHERRRNDAE